MERKTITYNKFLDCEIESTPKGNSFQKCYYGLSDTHWDRILAVSAIFSRAKIGPSILAVENEGIDYRCITYQKVIAFDNDRKPKDMASLSRKQIIKMILRTVDIMHNLGYGHGDLHIFNLGYYDGNIYLLDYDTVYDLSSLEKLQNHPWLESWIVERWDGDVEYFRKSDYEAWNSDWLEE